MARRFHIPLISITAVVMLLLVIFFFMGAGLEAEEKELPEKIDIFLYDNLGLTPEEHKIAGSREVYSKDEFVLEARARTILRENSGNPLIANLDFTDAVSGFQKKATVFDIAGDGMQKKTLVEIRFRADRDVDALKIVENIPKSTALPDDIQLTQGGIIAERDPILLFTFNDVKQGSALKAVYVINKGMASLETTTFAAEETEARPREAAVCGDGKCVEGESYLSCCADCGCLPGFSCEKGQCVFIEVDECSSNAECDDGDASTRDVCSGVPRTCQNIPITECTSGDNYCPEGCEYESDTDCEAVEAAEEVNVTGLNITGEQESPDISNVMVRPENATIGEYIIVEAKVVDANGKEDIKRVWFEVLELAQSHGEIEDMNDLGKDGDASAGDDIYTATREIAEYYLESHYRLNIFAEDHAGNRKKMQAGFRVVEPES